MFNSDLESEFQNFRSSIPQRKVKILFIYFSWEPVMNNTRGA